MATQTLILDPKKTNRLRIGESLTELPQPFAKRVEGDPDYATVVIELFSLTLEGGRQCVWNVTHARNLASGRQAGACLDLASCADWLVEGRVAVDEADWWDPELDLATPVLAVRFTKKHDHIVVPIDGWHRIRRAIQNGLEELPLILLSPEESRSVLVGIRPLGNLTSKEYGELFNMCLEQHQEGKFTARRLLRRAFLHTVTPSTELAGIQRSLGEGHSW